MTANWESFEIFTIESATGNNKLYANGRQTIHVRTAIKVLDINHQPVKLTSKERSSITLVNYHSGRVLKYTDQGSTSPLDPSGVHKWDYSRLNIGGYEHFPSSGVNVAHAPELEEIGTHSFDKVYNNFFVRTVDLNPIKLRARITRDDGQEFFSTDLGDASFTLAPVRPTSQNVSDYTLEKTVIVPRRDLGYSGGVAWLYYYELRLKTAPNLLFREVTCAPGGMHGDTGPGWELYSADMIGCVSPGQTVIKYLFPLKYVDTALKWDARPGKVLFTNTYVLAGSGYYFSTLVGKKAVLSCSVTAIDEYGNVHRFRLRFENGARFGDLQLV
ncbi:hypothetical protein NLO98_23965 [Pseudomonas syringae]|nr:hypothetical protein [Pseudomonas syringae]